MYVVEGSLEEIQQLRIGKRWGHDRRVGGEGVGGDWGITSKRRGVNHRGGHRPGMQRSTSVGLETPRVLAEVVAVPALDNIREAMGQTKREGLFHFVLLIEVLDVSRRRRVG